MPVVVYRRPWFWGVVIAAVAILTFTVIIAASGPDRDRREPDVIVQPPAQPAPVPPPGVQVAPMPAPHLQPAPEPAPAPPGVTIRPAPAEPAPSAAPARPARPASPPPAAKARPPQVIREKTVIIPEPVPRATPGAPAAALFRDTGLPREIRFDSARYQAASTMTVTAPETELTAIELAEDGTALYVTVNAQPPYQTVLAAVPDQEGVYVLYRRR
jgi:hypothetical protein